MNLAIHILLNSAILIAVARYARHPSDVYFSILSGMSIFILIEAAVVWATTASLALSLPSARLANVAANLSAVKNLLKEFGSVLSGFQEGMIIMISVKAGHWLLLCACIAYATGKLSRSFAARAYMRKIVINPRTKSAVMNVHIK